MSAYYNEIDPFAAAWLRELIKAGQIADGEVDARSIADVRPDDLRGFRQCHFFAGIGGWSYALRLAGWPDDRAVWTGSCPCQPFSSAGAQAGGHDSRDLWPVWFQLIAECRPDVVFGEQVEAAIGHGWLDRLCDDLESEGYAVGPCGLPAASVGAFHIRQRLWFVADTEHTERRPVGGPVEDERDRHDTGRPEAHGQSGARRAVCDVADTDGERRTRERLLLRPETRGRHASEVPEAAGSGIAGGLADATRRDQRRHSGEPRGTANACGGEAWASNGHPVGSASDLGDPARRGLGIDGSAWRHAGHAHEPIAVDGLGDTTREQMGRAGQPRQDFWRDCDWLPCTDGKARPVEPGTFPLASGVSARVGRLRGYGNAIVPQVAAAFIEAYCEAV